MANNSKPVPHQVNVTAHLEVVTERLAPGVAGVTLSMSPADADKFLALMGESPIRVTAGVMEHQSKDPNQSYGPDRVWVRVGEDSTGRACVANWMPSHAGTAHGPPPSEGTWQQYVRADAQPTECKSNDLEAAVAICELLGVDPEKSAELVMAEFPATEYRSDAGTLAMVERRLAEYCGKHDSPFIQGVLDAIRETGCGPVDGGSND
jgi:hypothetical protein